ncbi:MAG: radical SAM protein [archaeon]|nr:radical SAM protein [archaeon]
MSLKEIKEFSPKMKGWKMIGGSSANAPEAKLFDFRIHKDLAASLYDGMTGKEVTERQRTLEEWNRWMVLGADIVTSHQDFPHPLMVEIESYRGCHRYASGGCAFCIEPTKGRPLMREPEDILEEARRLRELGVRNIRVGGQTCIISYGSTDFESGVPRPVPSKVRSLFEGLRSLGFEHISVDNANPAVIATYPEESEEVIRTLAECCSSGNVLALGLESADPRVGAANNLNSTAEQVLDAIRLINKVGAERGPTGLPKILPGLNIICGLEGETFETYILNKEFLQRLVDENLLVRRINIRQVIDSRKEFHVKMNEKRFKKFKQSVREDVDHVMLERMVPVGTILKDVYMEIHDGSVTFGRQPGSYPLLVGVPYPLELDKSYDILVTEWGFRSITGITYPFDINSMPMSSLSALPGIGKKRAATLALKRPFTDFSDLSRAIDDPHVIEGLKGFIVFGPRD